MTAATLKKLTEVKALWRLMCEHEGKNPKEMFVVFEPTNPYRAEYDEAMGELQMLLQGNVRAQTPLAWGETEPAF